MKVNGMNSTVSSLLWITQFIFLGVMMAITGGGGSNGVKVVPLYSEEFRDRVIDLATEARIVTDLDGKINFCSPSVGMMLGYDSEEMLGKNIEEFMYDFQKGPHKKAMRNYVRNIEQRIGSVSRVECTMPTKDGRPIRLEVSIRVRRDPIYGIMIMTNLTPLDQIEHVSTAAWAQDSFVIDAE